MIIALSLLFCCTILIISDLHHVEDGSLTDVCYVYFLLPILRWYSFLRRPLKHHKAETTNNKQSGNNKQNG